MDRNEKIEFIEYVLIKYAQWSENLKNLILHKVKRSMKDASDICICDDDYGNFYVCVEYTDKTIHSLHEIKSNQIIEELYDLALFIKEE